MHRNVPWILWIQIFHWHGSSSTFSHNINQYYVSHYMNTTNLIVFFMRSFTSSKRIQRFYDYWNKCNDALNPNSPWNRSRQHFTITSISFMPPTIWILPIWLVFHDVIYPLKKENKSLSTQKCAHGSSESKSSLDMDLAQHFPII